MKKPKNNKKGTIGLYITFFILAVLVITIGAVLAPMGVLFNTEMLLAGEDIMMMANDSISSINNETIRNSIQSILSSGMSNVQNNIEVNSDLFQYSWLFVLLITGLVIFIASRRLIETQSKGGGGFV